MKIGVIGATGYVGKKLIPLLLEDGQYVRGICRSPEKLSIDHPNFEVASADLMDLKSLCLSLSGLDKVYLLAHGMNEGNGLLERETLCAKNIRTALIENNIQTLIYLGALLPETELSEHMQARQATSQILKSQQKTTVIELRAGIIIGSGSIAFEVMRDLVYHLPVLVMPPWVKSTSPPISEKNALYWLSKISSVELKEHQTFDIAGPEQISYGNQIQRFAKSIGKTRWLVPINYLPLKISTWWLWLITSAPTNTAKSLVMGLKHDLPGNASAIQKLLPQQLLSFEESIHSVIEQEQCTDSQSHRKDHPAIGFFCKEYSCSHEVAASSKKIWLTLQNHLGGKSGYFSHSWLWKTRAIMDKMVGGPGLSSPKPRSNYFIQGEFVDSWSIEKVKQNELLTLGFNMKAPGLGFLSVSLESISEEHTKVSLKAEWYPEGWKGLIYWWAVMPLHSIVFNGFLKGVENKTLHDSKSS